MKKIICDICGAECPPHSGYKSRIGDWDLCQECKTAEMDIDYVQEYKKMIRWASIKREATT